MVPPLCVNLSHSCPFVDTTGPFLVSTLFHLFFFQNCPMNVKFSATSSTLVKMHRSKMVFCRALRSLLPLHPLPSFSLPFSVKFSSSQPSVLSACRNHPLKFSSFPRFFFATVLWRPGSVFLSPISGTPSSRLRPVSLYASVEKPPEIPRKLKFFVLFLLFVSRFLGFCVLSLSHQKSLPLIYSLRFLAGLRHPNRPILVQSLPFPTFIGPLV